MVVSTTRTSVMGQPRVSDTTLRMGNGLFTGQRTRVSPVPGS